MLRFYVIDENDQPALLAEKPLEGPMRLKMSIELMDMEGRHVASSVITFKAVLAHEDERDELKPGAKSPKMRKPKPA